MRCRGRRHGRSRHASASRPAPVRTLPLWQDGGMAAWIWLSAAVCCRIAEALGGEFVLLMLGAGALVTAGVALVIPEAVDPADRVRDRLGGAGGAGPAGAAAKFHVKDQIKTNVEAIVGSKATVISTVDSHGGQVKIGGEMWSAAGVDGPPSVAAGHAGDRGRGPGSDRRRHLGVGSSTVDPVASSPSSSRSWRWSWWSGRSR